MSNKMERMNRLIEILKSKNGASVKELATYFDVSEMTIRRDLSVLHEKGIVSNVYGAAIINPDISNASSNPYHLQSAITSHRTEKDKIGQFASTLIKSNDVVIIDTGSTTETIAQYISSTIPLTILCYNHNILNHLLTKSNIKLIFSGGFYHSNTQMFESKEGISLIQNIRATKVFVSAAGVHDTMGVTCMNSYEIDTKQAIMQSGFERILLVDSSKFSVIQSSYFANLNQFQTIVTDSKIPDKWVSIIAAHGITLHIV